MPYAGAATLMALFKNVELGIADLAALFGNNPPTPLFPLPTTSHITSQHVSGEILAVVRAAWTGGSRSLCGFGIWALGRRAVGFVTVYASPRSLFRTICQRYHHLVWGLSRGFDSIDLHTQSLFVLLKWAQENGHATWGGAGPEFYHALVSRWRSDRRHCSWARALGARCGFAARRNDCIFGVV